MAGETFQQIADALGYKDHTGAIFAVKSALEKTLREPADRWRALTIERLTKILHIFWPKMLEGDEKGADRVFKAIADLRAVLGLDAPEKHEHTGKGGKPIEFTLKLGDDDSDEDNI